jgi:hypothetical protein
MQEEKNNNESTALPNITQRKKKNSDVSRSDENIDIKLCKNVETPNGA